MKEFIEKAGLTRRPIDSVPNLNAI